MRGKAIVLAVLVLAGCAAPSRDQATPPGIPSGLPPVLDGSIAEYRLEGQDLSSQIRLKFVADPLGIRFDGSQVASYGIEAEPLVLSQSGFDQSHILPGQAALHTFSLDWPEPLAVAPLERGNGWYLTQLNSATTRLLPLRDAPLLGFYPTLHLGAADAVIEAGGTRLAQDWLGDGATIRYERDGEVVLVLQTSYLDKPVPEQIQARFGPSMGAGQAWNASLVSWTAGTGGPLAFRHLTPLPSAAPVPQSSMQPFASQLGDVLAPPFERDFDVFHPLAAYKSVADQRVTHPTNVAQDLWTVGMSWRYGYHMYADAQGNPIDPTGTALAVWGFDFVDLVGTGAVTKGTAASMPEHRSGETTFFEPTQFQDRPGPDNASWQPSQEPLLDFASVLERYFPLLGDRPLHWVEFRDWTTSKVSLGREWTLATGCLPAPDNAAMLIVSADSGELTWYALDLGPAGLGACSVGMRPIG